MVLTMANFAYQNMVHRIRTLAKKITRKHGPPKTRKIIIKERHISKRAQQELVPHER